MKALVIDRNTSTGEASVSLQEVDQPIPSKGDALIKVRLAGICRTDQELVKGYMSFTGIPGHEFVGEVVDVAEPDDRHWIGKRVVGEINCGCGECEYCKAGLERHCLGRTVLGIQGRPGVFSEYTTLPVRNLLVVPDSVSDTTAVFVEPVAAALEILEQVLIKPDSRVLVIGDGKLGLLVAKVMQIHGCQLTCCGRSEIKTGLLEAWGIPTIGESDTGDNQFDVVVEASGSPDGFYLAQRAVKPRGTIVLKSTYAGDLTLNAAPLVVDEISVIGSRCGPFAPALRLLEQGLIRVNDLVTEVYSCQAAEAALSAASEADVIKVVVNFEW